MSGRHHPQSNLPLRNFNANCCCLSSAVLTFLCIIELTLKKALEKLAELWIFQFLVDSQLICIFCQNPQEGYLCHMAIRFHMMSMCVTDQNKYGIRRQCSGVFRLKLLVVKRLLKGFDGKVKTAAMGLLPDTQNYGLRMRRECRERFPRHRELAILICTTARAWRTCRDACRDR